MNNQLPLSTVMLLWLLMAVSILLFCNWHIRITYVATGINLKGSYNKNKKRYQNRWTLLQRWLLIPLLKQRKFRIYTFIFVLYYLIVLLTIITTIVMVLSFKYEIKTLFFVPDYYYFILWGISVIVEMGVTWNVSKW